MNDIIMGDNIIKNDMQKYELSLKCQLEKLKKTMTTNDCLKLGGISFRNVKTIWHSG